ncbi:hypothetical protein MUK42_18818 [Musa troglodytarum]|uniref:Uncharacterized protein n=1 Tax=Musa troglodytarum TaxID=320322 RepID=A0A9E7JKP2_9LILI|nr:hypothetical protein MUK42_07732 [Musa troglodytarum]URD84361.1 hypothetical protein MUK42_18818 [Musa troglodytarum]
MPATWAQVSIDLCFTGSLRPWKHPPQSPWSCGSMEVSIRQLSRIVC